MKTTREFLFALIGLAALAAAGQVVAQEYQVVEPKAATITLYRYQGEPHIKVSYALEYSDGDSQFIRNVSQTYNEAIIL